MMQRLPLLALTALLLVACTLKYEEVTPPPATAVPPSLEPVLNSSVGPYPDMVSLLEGVCFEYLYTQNGQTWTWTSPDDLAAFYDRVDASQLCSGPAARREFDFSNQMLVGAVNVATGCDAFHDFSDLVQDDTARLRTLHLRFTVQPGCDYELVQPFLIALPHPPDGYSVRVVMVPGN